MKMTDAVRGRRVQWAIGWVLLLLTGGAQAQDAARTRSHVATDPRTVLVMGDSLSAAYNMPAAQGWVALTADRVSAQVPGWRVVNASISGETTAGGAARIVDAVVRHRPSVVVVQLGANDALRGLPLRQARRNLARMIGAAQGIGAEVLLVGMRIPPNYGAAYASEFERGYRDLATRFDATLLPFLLQPIAMSRESFQADNLHPSASTQPAIRDHVWRQLAPMLRTAGTR